MWNNYLFIDVEVMRWDTPTKECLLIVHRLQIHNREKTAKQKNERNASSTIKRLTAEKTAKQILNLGINVYKQLIKEVWLNWMNNIIEGVKIETLG